jgi:hypothetical protein
MLKPATLLPCLSQAVQRFSMVRASLGLRANKFHHIEFFKQIKVVVGH